MTPSTVRITFPGSQGDELAARLDLPAGTVRAYALFAHCFTCSKDVIAARHIAAKLAALGIAVLRSKIDQVSQDDPRRRHQGAVYPGGSQTSCGPQTSLRR